MKIAITTGSPENNFAILLLSELLKNFPQFEIVILSTEKIGAKNKIRRLGLAKLTRFMKGKFKLSFLDKEVKNKVGFNRSLHSYSKRKGLEYLCVNNFNSKNTSDLLTRYSFDYMINTGGGIFKRNFLSLPKFGVLNAHMGKLPEIRGMNALEWSLLKSIPIGVSLHYIDEGIDTGPVIEFKKMEIKPLDSLQSIRERSNLVNVNLILKAFKEAKNYGHPIKGKTQKLGDGVQHYILHRSLKEIAEKKLVYEESDINV